MLTPLRYIRRLKLDKLAETLGCVMKDENTIINKWPFHLDWVCTGEEGELERLERQLGWAVVGRERYVEWKWGSESDRTS